MPKATAACVIKWSTDQAAVEPPVLRCADDNLDALIFASRCDWHRRTVRMAERVC
jgi:hypothetical protein